MKHKGFSYIEMMVALFLVSIIVQILLQSYAQSKQQALHFEKALSQSLEIQWIQEILSQSIRRAGFSPCLGVNSLKLPFKGAQIEQNSVLKIHRMDEHFSQLLRVVNDKQLLVERGVVFHSQQNVMIAGCEQAQLNQIDKVYSSEEGTYLLLQKPLYGRLDDKSYVGAFIAEKWFVKAKQGLFYESQQTEAISSMVESMQIYAKHSLFDVILTLVGGDQYQFSVSVRGQ